MSLERSPKAGRERSARSRRPAGSAGGALRVRMYNVLFGDAILVSVFEGREARHLLIDVGNVTGSGGSVSVFKPVFDDVLSELDGRPLDLYVMTHEHMDHVKGPLYAEDQLGLDLKKTLKARQAWLTASSAVGYYDSHPEARKKRLEMAESLHAMTRDLIARRLGGKLAAGRPSTAADLIKAIAKGKPPSDATDQDEDQAVIHRLAALLLNNDFQSTEKCVDYIRNLAAEADTFYVHRDFSPPRPPDLLSAGLSIWGPEEDTSIYYGRLRPVALGPTAEGPAGAGGAPTPRLVPPSGVDAGAFFDLVESRRRGVGENLLTIDQATNNTSVVFLLEWRGWRLLFPGDAEEKSWKIMDRRGLLDSPVDFLKIGHHGSRNGTPPTATLDKILPVDGQPRFAVVCTCAGVYGKSEETAVPSKKALDELARRSTVCSVESLPEGGHLDLIFYADRSRPVALKPEGVSRHG
jgi:hypothetical protein